jgi:hypothetical protein
MRGVTKGCSENEKQQEEDGAKCDEHVNGYKTTFLGI